MWLMYDRPMYDSRVLDDSVGVSSKIQQDILLTYKLGFKIKILIFMLQGLKNFIFLGYW